MHRFRRLLLRFLHKSVDASVRCLAQNSALLWSDSPIREGDRLLFTDRPPGASRAISRAAMSAGAAVRAALPEPTKASEFAALPPTAQKTPCPRMSAGRTWRPVRETVTGNPRLVDAVCDSKRGAPPTAAFSRSGAPLLVLGEGRLATQAPF